ncbi:MAG: methyltransferase domain-containing protein [Roseivirga sp.]
MKSQPGRVGAIAPSSEGLTKLMVREALKALNDTEDFVIEIGPGTGPFTRALLAQGVPRDKLICVELDPELHDYMVMNFPDVQIILGDAARLDELLPKHVGKVRTIISGIPLKNMTSQQQENIMKACCAILKPQGRMVQFTYGLRPTMTLPGFERSFVGFVLLNIPPASV